MGSTYFKLRQWHRSIPCVRRHPWFKALDLSRNKILRFSYLRLGHNFFFLHFLQFMYTLLHTLLVWRRDRDICRIIFYCPYSHKRAILFPCLSYYGYHSSVIKLLLDSPSPPIISLIIHFILNCSTLAF